MRNYIKEMKVSLENDGRYTQEDIDEIIRLESAYADRCDEIAEECSAEGYPSHGSNYELRCDNVRKYYDEQLELIYSKYEEDEIPEDSQPEPRLSLVRKIIRRIKRIYRWIKWNLPQKKENLDYLWGYSEDDDVEYVEEVPEEEV